MIKIAHTADWHLGKKLFRQDRLQEQKLFLDWLRASISQNNIDALLISGDIFDHPIPPHEALSAYFDFLFQITQETDCQIFVIAGNHDSGQFLEAPKGLLSKQNVHVIGKIQDDLNTHHQVFTIKGEEVLISFLPYFRQYEILKHLETTQAESQDIHAFFKSFFQLSMQEKYSHIKTKILMAHHLFGSYESSGSEQVVSLSGLESFPRDLYQDCYQYVALGHIHKTQTLHHHPFVIYPGSPIAMRFGESEQKYISLFQTGEELTQSFLPIPILYPLKQIKVKREKLFESLDKLILTSKNYSREVYLEIEVQLLAPESGLIDEVKAYLKKSNINLLSFFMITGNTSEVRKAKRDIISLAPEELFESFYQKKYPENQMPKALKEDFSWLMDLTRLDKDTHENQ